MDISREQLASVLRKVFLFNRLTSEQMDSLLSAAELVYFPTGKLIYLENAQAQALYVVYEGLVEILKERKQALVHKNLVKAGHAFGEDIFAHAPRRTSARAQEDTILIKLDKEAVHTIAAENNACRDAAARQFASYNYLIDSRFKALPGETLCFISQPHPIAVISKMAGLLLSFLIAGFFLFIFRNAGLLSSGLLQWTVAGLSTAGIAWLLYTYFEWANDYFFFTDKRVSSTQRKYLLFEERQESPLSAVESVQVRKSLLGRALDFGDLDVSTYTGATRIRQVPAVENAFALLQYLVRRRRSQADDEALDAFRDDLQARIQPLAGKMMADSQEDEPEYARLEDRNADKFDNTETDADQVILRKHFTVLISKTFIPVLLLLSHLFFYLFVRINQLPIATSAWFNGWMASATFILLLWALYRYADWHNDRFIITDETLVDIDRKPFGSEDTRSAPLERIQSVRYKKNGIFGLLFNFGTVFIRIGDEEFTFDDLYQPAQVTEWIFAAKENRMEREKAMQQHADEQRALGWLETYHRLQKQEKNKKRP